MVELSQKRCFVMDTSLFISYVNGELWANHAAYQTNYPPCPILVPLDVKREFKKYAYQIVKNSQALAKELIKCGFTLVGGGSANHMIWIDLTNKGIDGWSAAWALEYAGIIANVLPAAA